MPLLDKDTTSAEAWDMVMEKKPAKKGSKSLYLADSSEAKLKKVEKQVETEYSKYTALEKSILTVLDGSMEEGPTIERLAFERDPTQNNFSSIYVPKERLTPDWLCKRIAIQCQILAACLQLRQNQLAAFARKRPNRSTTGYEIQLTQETVEKIEHDSSTDEEKRAAKAEWQSRIAKACKLIQSCGYSGSYRMLAPEGNGYINSYQPKMSFPQFMSQITRNALVVGRIAVEVINQPTKDGPKFFCFRPVDAGTIYQARPQIYSETEDVKKRIRDTLNKLNGKYGSKRLDPKKFVQDEYAWVQVVDGIPVQAFTAEELRVQNFYAVPDIELNGYPVTPIDMALVSIITHINVSTYTKLFFEAGKGCKGMLVVKSEDVDQKYIDKVKQVFNTQVNSVSNCITGDSQIITENGAFTVEDFLGGQETRMTRVWTGTSWEQAMAYRVAQPKKLCQTNLANGLVMKTSPDHRFYVIGSDGLPAWKTQKELQVGDYLAVNKKNPTPGAKIPKFMGRDLTPEMMEVFGWIVGDGSIDAAHGVNMYYHHEKEYDIWQRHAKILEDWGCGYSVKERQVTEEEAEYLKEKYGFKTIAPIRISTHIFMDFLNEFLKLGFTPSDKAEGGKSIPPFVYALPEDLKGAFLKGFFSADGNNAKQRSPRITILNSKLRAQTRQLLMSMGIRCTLDEGKTHWSFKKGRVKGASYLNVKDRLEFFEKVGFIQAHKQPRETGGTNKGWGVSSRVPMSTVLHFLRLVKDKTRIGRNAERYSETKPERVFTKREQCDIDSILREDERCSLPRLKNYMAKAGVEIPQWLQDFNYEPVVELSRTDQEVQMFDMTVYEKTHTCLGIDCQDDSHSLVINGIYQHQSWRMPVFGITLTDDITWQPIEGGGGKDMEFQYLNDMTARMILSALSMDPEEVSGWRYLSRGTASQALSEGNKEYQLEAARDTGIRPLLAQMEDFMNEEIMPLIDPGLAEAATFKFVGLEAETAEKESARFTTDLQLHLTMDEMLEKVEKRPIGKAWGGEFPLNPMFQNTVLFKMFTIGQLLEHFCGIEGASKDPNYAYIPDQSWFTNQQLIQATQQAQQQQAAQAQGAAPGQPQGAPQGQQDPNAQGVPTELQRTGDSQGNGDESDQKLQDPDMESSINQAVDSLQKADPVRREKLLQQQKAALSLAMDGMAIDAQAALGEIMSMMGQKPGKGKSRAKKSS